MHHEYDIAPQCVSCNTILAMKGKGKDMKRESGEGALSLYISIMNITKPQEGIPYNVNEEVVNIYVHARENHFDSHIYDIDDNVFFLKRFVSLKSFPHVYICFIKL